MEKRFNASEVRASKSTDGKMTIRGYAAVYHQLSNPIPTGDGQTFRERIKPGAFDKVLRKNPDVIMTLNHNTDKILGRTSAGTLRLAADTKGLRFECELPDAPTGQDVYAAVQRGELRCSFAFDVDDSRMCDYDEEDIEDDRSMVGRVKKFFQVIVRTIKEFANLYDVSVVCHPAYPGTSVDARSIMVGAEARSRVCAMAKRPYVSPEQFRQRIQGPSFEGMIAQHKTDLVEVRRRRLAILDM
ncbi:MAG TPA: HK97 family phage prohead protease [Candidatus Acidoferrum sp.]|jgi:hypothetical protein